MEFNLIEKAICVWKRVSQVLNLVMQVVVIGDPKDE